MASRGEHAWKDKTAEGQVREVRARRFGGQWRAQSRLKGDPGWIYHDKLSAEDLRALLEILRRKYQRRRASHDDVRSVELLLRQI